MQLVDGIPNYIQVYDDDNIPPTDEWLFDDLNAVMEEAMFQLHRCGKYTLIYRSEITLRRSGPNVYGVESLIVEVECSRNGETLRYAGNLQTLDHLPVQSFKVYDLKLMADGDARVDKITRR